MFYSLDWISRRCLMCETFLSKALMSLKRPQVEAVPLQPLTNLQTLPLIHDSRSSSAHPPQVIFPTAKCTLQPATIPLRPLQPFHPSPYPTDKEGKKHLKYLQKSSQNSKATTLRTRMPRSTVSVLGMLVLCATLCFGTSRTYKSIQTPILSNPRSLCGKN